MRHSRDAIRWIWMLGSLAAIGVATGIGLIAPTFADIETDSFVRALVPTIMAIVAIVSIATTRLMTLPRMFDEPADQRLTGDPADVATSLACAFSIAPSIYGVVASTFTDVRWYGLIFGGLALLSLAIHLPYVNRRIEQLDYERRARGET